MDHVRLGGSGLRVSRLALGCMTYGSREWREWVLDEAAARPFFRQAWEAGINFFDTADMYSLGASEEVTGRALKELAPRHQQVIATKLYGPMGDAANDRGLSRKHVMEAIDASLKRLGTDYVDLWQIHRFDYDTPLEETLEALSDVVRAGKALYLGASSMHAWQMMKCLGLQRAHGWAPFVSMQDHYNLLYREEEREMLPLCRSEGIGVIPWSPLARGRLTRSAGTRTPRSGSDAMADEWYRDSAEAETVAAVEQVAQAHGVPMAQIALAWVAGRPGITAPIIGASKPHHIEDAVKGLGITLDQAEVAKLEAAYRPQPVRGHV